MNKKNNKRKKASKRKIEQAFFQLINEKEIEEITVTTICLLAQVNRSTFYANYIDINDLVEQIKNNMLTNIKNLYATEHEENLSLNDWKYRFTKLFYHIRENQVFYKIYFKLGFDLNFNDSQNIVTTLSSKVNNEFLKYHMEFLRGGIISLTKMWLNYNCELSPETLVDILENEYKYFFESNL